MAVREKGRNIPLALKTFVNPEWKEALVKQGKTVASCTVNRDGDTAFVTYQAMQGKGIITVSQFK